MEKSFDASLTLLVGFWKGNWGGGVLEVNITSDLIGEVYIIGHSDGVCSVRIEKNLVVCDINRDDGMKQGFVCSFTSPTRLDGQYVHWNCSAFTNMYLEKVSNVED